MSFKKYIEYKKKLKTQISIEDYKNRLNEELIKLSNKPNIIRLEELKKDLIDENKICRLLEESNYPYLEELRIALKTNDAKKIEKERKKICSFEEEVDPKIFSLLLFYESFFYSSVVSMNDINKIIESYENKTIEKLLNLATKIDDLKETIEWHNYPTLLEVLYPDKGFLPDEILLKIGNKFNKKIIINLFTNQIKTIDKEEDLPSSLKENSQNLIELLFSNKKNENKIANLYMIAPRKDRKKIENIKKELVLGIKHFLPSNYILCEENIQKEENFDVWSIRTDLNKLKKINNTYIALEEEAPLRWIKKT